MHDDEDAADARKVLAGDVEAFAGIVRRWQGPLFHLAWRFCHERSQAEDLTQEAFLHAFRSLAQWRGESQLSTWLVALAANVYRSHARRPARREQELDEVQQRSLASVEDREPDLASRVRKAVDAVPARYRDALVLYYFHAMDVRAAARSLALPEGTVKARLHRGRKLLEQILVADASSTGGTP